MKLLYAEDEESLAEAVVDVLSYHNYNVDTVYNGIDALDYARSKQYDGIILDIMMPGLNGLEVLSSIRKEGINTPVMLLTAKTEIEDRIAGLDLGADDYLPKPFSMGEMMARVRAMLRRGDEYYPDLISFGNVSLDRKKYIIFNGEKQAALSKIEYQILELLMMNHNMFFSTEDILIKVWGYDTDSDVGIVWVYLSYLRNRLKTIDANIKIKAKRGVGYSLETIDD